MNALTPLAQGDEPVGSIDGDFSVKSEEIIHTFQATVSSMVEKLNSKPGTDRGLENFMVDSAKADTTTAFFALRQYLVKRSAHALTRQIFDLALQGVKPKTSRKGNRFSYEWYDGFDLIAAYQVILIEIA